MEQDDRDVRKKTVLLWTSSSTAAGTSLAAGWMSVVIYTSGWTDEERQLLADSLDWERRYLFVDAGPAETATAETATIDKAGRSEWDCWDPTIDGLRRHIAGRLGKARDDASRAAAREAAMKAAKAQFWVIAETSTAKLCEALRQGDLVGDEHGCRLNHRVDILVELGVKLREVNGTPQIPWEFLGHLEMPEVLVAMAEADRVETTAREKALFEQTADLLERLAPGPSPNLADMFREGVLEDSAIEHEFSKYLRPLIEGYALEADLPEDLHVLDEPKFSTVQGYKSWKAIRERAEAPIFGQPITVILAMTPNRNLWIAVRATVLGRTIWVGGYLIVTSKH